MVDTTAWLPQIATQDHVRAPFQVSAPWLHDVTGAVQRSCGVAAFYAWGHAGQCGCLTPGTPAGQHRGQNYR